MIDLLLSAAAGAAVGAGGWLVWASWRDYQREIAAIDAARYRAHLADAVALLREAADVIDDLDAPFQRDAGAEDLIRRIGEFLATQRSRP